MRDERAGIHDFSMNRRGLFYVLVPLAILLLLTAPFYLSGRISLALIEEGLQRLDQADASPLIIQLEDYRGGLYQSRLKLVVKSRHGAFLPFIIDAHLQHGFCGIQTQMGFVDQAGQSILLSHQVDENPPRLGLKVGCYLSGLWSGPLTARLYVPALSLLAANESVQLQEALIKLVLQDQGEGGLLTASLPAFKLASENIGEISLSELRLDLRSDKARSTSLALKLALRRVEFTSPAIRAHAEEIVSSIRFDQQPASARTHWHLQAQESVVDAVPFIRLSGLDMRSELLSETVQGAGIALTLQQTTRVDSNYGAVEIRVASARQAVRISAGKSSLQQFADNPVQIQARIPHALLDVLFQTGMKPWLASGVMIDEGAVVSWKGNYSLGSSLLSGDGGYR